MAINPTGGLAGALGSQTCSIYALDPSGTTAMEPVADIVPGVSPLRITIDTIDSENYQVNYRVTQHTLQDLTDTTSHVYRELIKLTVVGVFGAAGPMGIGSGIAPSSGLARLARLDLLRYRNLKNLADQRRPVMVVTPRCSLARCFITGIPSNWTPSDGDSLPITLSFTEARVMRSESIAAFQDVDSLATGNNASTGGGTGGSVNSDLTPESFASIQGVPPLQPG
jgi:hypothetical protein